MPTPKNTLTITGLDEISFVPDGDNPPALIKLCKAKPAIPEAPMGEEQVEDTDFVAKERYLALEQKVAKMEEDAAFEKVASEAVNFNKSMGVVPGVDLARTLRAIDKAAPEAGQSIRKVLSVYSARAKAGLHTVGSFEKGGADALQQFNQKIDELRKSRPELRASEASDIIANQFPGLYASANGHGGAS
jgi:hypothetical protein